jgi:hypothetical protein
MTSLASLSKRLASLPGRLASTRWSVQLERPDAPDAGWKRVAPGLSWQRVVQEEGDAIHTTRSVRLDTRVLLGATGVGVAAFVACRDK